MVLLRAEIAMAAPMPVVEPKACGIMSEQINCAIFTNIPSEQISQQRRKHSPVLVSCCRLEQYTAEFSYKAGKATTEWRTYAHVTSI